MEGRNVTLSEAQEALAAARNAREEAKREKTDTSQPPVYYGFVQANVDSEHEYGRHNADQWEIQIQTLDGWIQTFNSGTQMEMTDLNRTMNQYNEITDVMTSALNKFNKTRETVLGNARS